MNLILLFPHDFVAPETACVTGRRAEHVRTVLGAEPGTWLKVGLIDGNMGKARIAQIKEGVVTLEVPPLDQAPPPTLPLTLLLALPRPRMLQRTLQTVATLGVQRLCLLQTARVEKSYWQTPLLEPETVAEQLYLGLEQARATQMPEVNYFRRFRPFMEDVLPSLAAGSENIIAHPGPYPPARPATAHHTLLAVGPEGGFIEGEVDTFIAAGFSPVQLGERILKVETAIPVLLSKLF